MTPIISNTAIVQVPPKTPLIPTVTVMPSPLIPTSTLIPSPTQNLIPTNDMSVVLTSTPDFFGGIDCPGAPIVKVQVNDLVMVATSNNDKLILRTKPILDKTTEERKLSYGAYLKIHDGPVCVKDPSSGLNYWFWEVKDKTTGEMGWVADGDSTMHFLIKAK